MEPVKIPRSPLLSEEMNVSVQMMYDEPELLPELTHQLQKEHTPFKLCHEIIERVKVNTHWKICVVSSIEFVALLIDYYKVPSTNIIFIDEGRDDSDDYSVKAITLMEFMDFPQTNFFHISEIEEIRMQHNKFDLVIGNPPFSLGRADGKGGKNKSDILYVQFFNMALTLSDNVAMIMPSTKNKKMKEHNANLSKVCTGYRDITPEEFPGPTIDMWYILAIKDATKEPIPFSIATESQNNITWGRGKVDMFEHKNTMRSLGFEDNFIGFSTKQNQTDVTLYHTVNETKGLVTYFVPDETIPKNKRFPNTGFVVLIPQTITDNGWSKTEIVKCEGQASLLNIKTVFFNNQEDAKRFVEFMKTREFIDGAIKVRAGFNQLTLSGLRSIKFHFQ